MKVRAIRNEESPNRDEIVFNNSKLQEGFVVNYSQIISNRDYAEYDIEMNKEYTVYGIMKYNDTIYYLIIGEYNMVPQWFPSDLFEIMDNRKPFNWIYSDKIENNQNINYIESYEKLSKDYDHMTNLIDMNSNDIKIFLKEKELIDEILSFKD